MSLGLGRLPGGPPEAPCSLLLFPIQPVHMPTEAPAGSLSGMGSQEPLQNSLHTPSRRLGNHSGGLEYHDVLCVYWMAGRCRGAATDLPLLSMMDVTLGTHSGQCGDCWMKNVNDTCLEEQMQQGPAVGLKSQGCDDRGGCYHGLLGDSPALCSRFILWRAGGAGAQRVSRN